MIPDVCSDEPRRGAAQPAFREGILLVHALVLHVEEDSARFLRHGDDARAGDVADEMARCFLAGEIADVLESRGKTGRHHHLRLAVQANHVEIERLALVGGDEAGGERHVGADRIDALPLGDLARTAIDVAMIIKGVGQIGVWE